MLPSLAVMWMLTVLFEKTLFSVGLNLLLVIPGLLGRCLPGMVSLPLLLQRLSCFSFSACIHHRGHCRYRLTAFSLYPLRPIDFSFGTFHIRQSLWQTNRFTEIKIYDQSVDEVERKYLFFSDKLTLIGEFYVL